MTMVRNVPVPPELYVQEDAMPDFRIIKPIYPYRFSALATAGLLTVFALALAHLDLQHEKDRVEDARVRDRIFNIETPVFREFDHPASLYDR
jgi:hypothetical protein